MKAKCVYLWNGLAYTKRSRLSAPEVDLVKIFLFTYTHAFCKLDHFMNVKDIVTKFYEIDA
jgi:hypothetical protein